ncbi:SCO0607 family lipoprotein [Streptomyces vietnamensis]|uniref:SCO0607 family lipoprotein n=1 Tax=Streptomyces vietnamensis TaxID=362257 RepID=UPI00341F89EF
MSRRISRPSIALRPGRVRIATAALAGSAAVVTLTGCAGIEYQEGICNSGGHPAMPVGGTGSACVSDGQEPPAGFVRYPEGKVPQQVGDKWDVHRDTHADDKDGDIIDAPDASCPGKEG